jgi:DNA-binding NarL/FixJ family response regulator
LKNLSRQIEIAIVDKDPITRHGLEEIFKNINFISKVNMYSSGKDLIRALKSRAFDLVVINTVHSVKIVESVRNLLPNTKVLILNLYVSLGEILEIYKMEIHEHITKNTSADGLKNAVQKIITGGNYCCKSLNTDLINLLIRWDKSRLSGECRSLTAREKEVLKLICEQFSSEEIASKLFLSPKTVKRHREILFDKTGVKNVAGLVIYAIKNKIYLV